MHLVTIKYSLNLIKNYPELYTCIQNHYSYFPAADLYHALT